MSIKSGVDRMLARFFTRYPFLVERWARKGRFVTNIDIPWATFTKDLEECRVALVTTAGVHLRWQPPFNMEDKDGDPTFREIPSWVDSEDLRITHNYYDHRDADRDINVVFPIERLRELEGDGIIRKVAFRHFSFMGHIMGQHLKALIEKTAPEVAKLFKRDGVDAVFLTPA
jgi:D-proline reductase (dithiol) PrdB